MSRFQYTVEDLDLDTIQVDTDNDQVGELAGLITVTIEQDCDRSAVELSALQAEELAASLMIAAGIARGNTLLSLANAR